MLSERSEAAKAFETRLFERQCGRDGQKEGLRTDVHKELVNVRSGLGRGLNEENSILFSVKLSVLA